MKKKKRKVNKYASMMGKLSVKERFSGKTKEEISEMMRRVQKGRKVINS